MYSNSQYCVQNIEYGLHREAAQNSTVEQTAAEKEDLLMEKYEAELAELDTLETATTPAQPLIASTHIEPDTKLLNQPAALIRPALTSTNVIKPASITQYNSSAIIKIGPEFKAQKNGPQITTSSLNVVPYPEGYVPRKRGANNANGMVHSSVTRIVNSSSTSEPYYPPTKQRGKVDKVIAIRAAGGEIWEDKSLLTWDQGDFRLYAGGMGNEVTGELLNRSFRHFPSLLQTHVVRDKRTGKSKGYGFISFRDENDYVAAMREMNGKYVGNRPILLRKSTWKDRIGTEETVKYQKALGDIAKSVTK